ncbi:MAG: hypothetical protein KatS3mg053_3049 [Candidatus Roseilinea sp.]|nr:MAG: hypothetical protein KatS3mg053_3049 [Candidatus Roseilinea sp.]
MDRRLAHAPVAIATCLCSLLITGHRLAGPPVPAQPAEPTVAPGLPWAYLPIVLSAPDDLLYVRAYFSDRNMLDALGEYTDLNETEVNLDESYVVLEITPAQKIELEELGLRVIIDEALMAQAREFRGGEVGVNRIPGYACYRTVEETFDAARQIVTQHPNLAEWIDIGDSWEKTQNPARGYDLMVLRLTNRAIAGSKPKLFIMSGLHAREYTPPELAMRFAEHLVANYGLDPDVTWMLDHQEVHLLLQANPDGRKQAEAGLPWRKNTDNLFCSNTNTRGVDLNRNFSFLWNTCQGGSCGSDNPCSIVYRGPSASSEPETQAIQNYLRAQFADNREPPLNAGAPLTTSGVMIDLHSYGQLVLWPYANGATPANNDGFLALGDRMAYYNGYDPRQGSGLYLHDGVSDDFAYGELGVAAFTFELGTSFFQNCASFERGIYEGNLRALLYAAKVARAPYLLPSGPETILLTASPASVTPGAPVQLSATVDDGRMKQGLKPAHAIADARYTIDTPPWQAGATFIPMTAGDGAFNSVSERVVATINTTGLAAGRHIVYVQGRDAQGNWGPVGATFLTIEGPVTPTPTLTATPPTPPTPSLTPTSTSTPTPATPTSTPTRTPTPGNTIFADDFATDKGWRVNPARTDRAVSGQWERGRPQATAYSRWAMQLGAASGAFDLVTGPLAGTAVGQHDVDGGVTSVRSPAIALPTLVAGQNLTLKLSYYLAHTANSSADDFLRIKIVGNTTATVFEELGATHYDAAAWTQLNINLNAFAGQTIYVLIEAADLSRPSVVEAAVDDVVIQVE